MGPHGACLGDHPAEGIVAVLDGAAGVHGGVPILP
jgi:hypothetical protein